MGRSHHRDQTKVGRTLVHHAELLVFCQCHGSTTRKVTKFAVRQDNEKKKDERVDRVQVWAQSPMNTENTAVDDSAEGQVIENFATPPPNVAAPIVIEPVDLGNLPRLMVATNEGDPLRISDFQSK
jgi:hypothetical protein